MPPPPPNVAEIVASAAANVTDVSAPEAALKPYPKSWKEIKFNPPLHRGASGARVNYLDGDKPADLTSRASVMGTDSYKLRTSRKGVLFQHIAYQQDWNYGFNETGQSVLDGNRYGFRFHYNPSTVDHAIGVNNEGINPSILMAGTTQAKPITTNNMPTIRFQLFLNRIEDMTLLDPSASRYNGTARFRAAHRQWRKKLAALRKQGASPKAIANFMAQEPKAKDFRATADDLTLADTESLYFYGRTLSKEDVEGIWTRGTGYDLEYLYRTILGRPFPSVLRGDTADVGIAFGVPLILDFNAGMKPYGENSQGVQNQGVRHSQRYVGRVESISYTHLAFNERLVPTWTQVSLTFVRYPDIAPGTIGDSNYDPNGPGPRSPNAVENTPAYTTESTGADEVLEGFGHRPWGGVAPTTPGTNNPGAQEILDE